MHHEKSNIGGNLYPPKKPSGQFLSDYALPPASHLLQREILENCQTNQKPVPKSEPSLIKYWIKLGNIGPSQ